MNKLLNLALLFRRPAVVVHIDGLTPERSAAAIDAIRAQIENLNGQLADKRRTVDDTTKRCETYSQWLDEAHGKIYNTKKEIADLIAQRNALEATIYG
ncbi:hypothetical protein LAV_00178 [Sphingobium phage Lacusarx]|uniref:Uncharacterized protein n=1 Tax=Sphingobium phage Lacusarx TaxID=1980139 RepID=A0A1W6DXA3_9CAUD|nr:hypothetical protein FDH44_gp125 [Sphingobium phage Lacusarx]ARK07553.1 hypothetical protein LAV_00178 [Sphingobium phage Lacusarx]